MNDFSTVGNYDTIEVFIMSCICCRTIQFIDKFKELNVLCKEVPNKFNLIADDLIRSGIYLTFYNHGNVVGTMRTIADVEAIKQLHDVASVHQQSDDKHNLINKIKRFLHIN